MSFSSVPNVLDDATHEALDKKVNNRVGPHPTEYMFLLQIIVAFSN